MHGLLYADIVHDLGLAGSTLGTYKRPILSCIHSDTFSMTT